MSRRVRRALERLRSVRWAAGQLRRVRRQIDEQGLGQAIAPSPAGRHGEHAVTVTLAAGRASCLERSLILQRWLADRDRPHDLVVGVCIDDGVKAHAWLDGYDADASDRFRELRRQPAR